MTRPLGLRLAVLFLLIFNVGLKAQQQGSFDSGEASPPTAASAAKVSDTVWTQSGASAWMSFSNPNAKVGDTVSVLFNFGSTVTPAVNVSQVILTWEYDPRMVKIIGTQTDRSSSWLVGDALGNALASLDGNAHKLEVKLWRTNPQSVKTGAGEVVKLADGIVILDIDMLKRGISTVAARVVAPTSDPACLRVAPNPSQERIWIVDDCGDIPRTSKVTVTNLNGEVCYEGWIGEDGLSVGSWVGGLYFIRFQADGALAPAKLLIQRN